MSLLLTLVATAPTRFSKRHRCNDYRLLTGIKVSHICNGLAFALGFRFVNASSVLKSLRSVVHVASQRRLHLNADFH